ncbi:class I SAM-dependent methyltransferase [Agaribacter marinus]|uniref:Methyltransferase domain-containing protein n=1 Tax=Agaribacter marinus TaxID=1431249 RepID=A0AA37WIN5_9ALTE|nr:class I SAM-dependent methyltransferase [Agaribacter marinus]GLR71313.1 hypothetical protein GCM10007852_22210 [Agaribacter marinus]
MKTKKPKKTEVHALYDQLFVTESKYKKNNLYPIHKVLAFSENDICDIYQWIEKYIGFPETGDILDAGCGVGWGTSFIAQHTEAKVLGISISPNEIDQAHMVHQTQKGTSENQLSFACLSFDEVKDKQYSMIIAVESIKHSPNIQLTLIGLINALTPDGTLVVVEDTLQAITCKNQLGALMSDWQLSEVLSQSHMDPNNLTNAKDSVEYQQFDFTHLMQNTPTLLTNLKLGIMTVLLMIKPKHMGWQAFRGGFILDKLYKKKRMKYLAHIYRKIN